jgi:hypothetical protein
LGAFLLLRHHSQDVTLLIQVFPVGVHRYVSSFMSFWFHCYPSWSLVYRHAEGMSLLFVSNLDAFLMLRHHSQDVILLLQVLPVGVYRYVSSFFGCSLFCSPSWSVVYRHAKGVSLLFVSHLGAFLMLRHHSQDVTLLIQVLPVGVYRYVSSFCGCSLFCSPPWSVVYRHAKGVSLLFVSHLGAFLMLRHHSQVVTLLLQMLLVGVDIYVSSLFGCSLFCSPSWALVCRHAEGMSLLFVSHLDAFLMLRHHSQDVCFPGGVLALPLCCLACAYSIVI